MLVGGQGQLSQSAPSLPLQELADISTGAHGCCPPPSPGGWPSFQTLVHLAAASHTRCHSGWSSVTIHSDCTLWPLASLSLPRVRTCFLSTSHSLNKGITYILQQAAQILKRWVNFHTGTHTPPFKSWWRICAPLQKIPWYPFLTSTKPSPQISLACSWTWSKCNHTLWTLI